MHISDRQNREASKWTKDDTELTILALPTTIWYVLFCYLPMFGIILAFKDLPYMHDDDNGRPIFRGGVPGDILAAAILISNIYSKRKSKAYQTLMFMPHFMSWVVVSYFVYAFLVTGPPPE